MRELINYLFDFGDKELFNFQLGYVVGVGVVLALAIMVKIIMLLLRRPEQCRGIVVDGDHGALMVSSRAVADLIKGLEDDFPALELIKISLLKRDRALALEISARYDADGGSLPEMTDELRTTIFQRLNSLMGIDSVKKIDFKIRRAERKPPSSRF